MMYVGVFFAAVILLGLVLEMKTSRHDGTLLKVHPYRRLIFFIMPTRSESVVFFDIDVDTAKLTPFLEKARKSMEANITHVTVAACGIALSANPKMNRFVVGYRLYQRNKRTLSFTIKRQKLGRDTKLATTKLDMIDGEDLRGFVGRVNGEIKEERKEGKSKSDNEVDLFNALPRPLLALGVPLIRLLDYYNLLPAVHIEPDPLYTSLFITNLGSVGMDSGFHHLFEYGNCPLFVMIGKSRDKVVVENGVPVVKHLMPIRFTFDERIEDGLNASFGIEALRAVLEDPEKYFGDPEAEKLPPLWPQPLESLPH